MRTIRVTMRMPGDAGATNEVSIETIAPENEEDARTSGAETVGVLKAFIDGMGEAS